MEEEKKEKTDERQPDQDTDSFQSVASGGLDGDKRGELAVILPEGDRVISRQGGIVSHPAKIEEGEVPPAAGVEKGSEFSGVLRDEQGVISLSQAETRGLMVEPPEEAASSQRDIVDYGQTEVLMPQRPEEAQKPSIEDFDLDFGPGTRRVEPRERREPATPEPPAHKPGKVKTSPSWMPPAEEKPLPPPAPVRPVEEKKEEIPFEMPEIPEDLPPPIIVKRRRMKEAKAEKAEAPPAPPPIEARSYMDDEPVVKQPAKAAQRPATKKKKKMKLPKRVKEGRRTSLLLVLLMILLFLILAGILAVQYVPEARKHYDRILAQLLGEKEKPGLAPSGEQPKEEVIVLEVGPTKVELKKGTDIGAAESYVKELRKLFSESRKVTSEKQK